MKAYLVLMIVFAGSALAAPRETKINLVAEERPETERLLAHYCRDFKIVANLDGSDYMLTILRSPKEQPYLWTVLDTLDPATSFAGRADSLAGAVKDACSAMHIRFGEGQGGQQ